jgi:hypothetical protein
MVPTSPMGMVLQGLDVSFDYLIQIVTDPAP